MFYVMLFVDHEKKNKINFILDDTYINRIVVIFLHCSQNNIREQCGCFFLDVTIFMFVDIPVFLYIFRWYERRFFWDKFHFHA